MKVLPHKVQYRILSQLTSEANKANKFTRLMMAASYGAIVGKMSEGNLLNLLRFLKINPGDSVVQDLLGFYCTAGMINIEDDGLGFANLITDSWEIPIVTKQQKEMVNRVKQTVEQVRRRYIT